MTKKMGTPSGGTQLSKRWAMLDQLYSSTRGLRLTYELDTNKLNATPVDQVCPEKEGPHSIKNGKQILDEDT